MNHVLLAGYLVSRVRQTSRGRRDLVCISTAELILLKKTKFLPNFPIIFALSQDRSQQIIDYIVLMCHRSISALVPGHTRNLVKIATAAFT
jgi:hypothetical protein